MPRRRRTGGPQRRKYAKIRCAGGTVRYNRSKGRCECRCMYTGNIVGVPLKRCKSAGVAGLKFGRRRRRR
jgi:hypothetical protein